MSNFVLSKPFIFSFHSPYYFKAKPRHLDLIIYTEELPKYLCIFVEIVLISFLAASHPFTEHATSYSNNPLFINIWNVSILLLQLCKVKYTKFI